uniref:ZP domain-containing protein n=1 Tax=Plectus sambesii TaxID=2011161 RepID=A0A914VB46_9BILA
MIVIVHFEADSSDFEQSRLRLSQNQTECRSNFNKLADSLELEIHLDKCSLAVDTADYVTKYSTMIDYFVQDELIDTFPVTCVHPNAISRTISATVQAKFYKNNNKSALLQSNSGHAFEVFLGSRLRFETVASIPWYNDEEFYTYPVTCWTSDYADQRPKAKKVVFLEKGCPAVSEKHRGLSRIVHDLTKAGSTAVDFALIEELLPNIRYNEDGTFPMVYAHCSVILCSGLSTTGFLNIPKCPKSSFCAGESAVSHRLPAHLVGHEKLHLVNGPISPVKPSEAPQTAETRRADDCVVRCRSANLRQTLTTEASRRIDTVLVQGVPMTTTMLVSFFSFLCGATLTVALWFIHVKTDPRRTLKLVDRRETCSSDSTDQPESTLISNCL